MKARTLLAATLAVAALAACGGSSNSGPPKAASLAAKLDCRVTGADGGQIAAYDTVQYVDASGGPCSTSAVGGQGIIIMIFASQGKETDWLHQNAAAESSNFPDGYDEVVSGNLWAIASGGYGAFPTSYVLRKLGGKDTTF